MRGFLKAAAASGAALLAVVAGSSAGNYQPAPLPAWVVSGGDVAAVAVSGSTAYLGGSFGYVGPETGPPAPLDEGAGTAAASPAPIAGNVYAVAADDAGGWYVGGAFASIGTRHADNLAHVL